MLEFYMFGNLIFFIIGILILTVKTLYDYKNYYWLYIIYFTVMFLSILCAVLVLTN